MNCLKTVTNSERWLEVWRAIRNATRFMQERTGSMDANLEEQKLYYDVRVQQIHLF